MRQTLKNKIREKKPKFSDEAILGPEPDTTSFEPTTINLLKAYNWYNYFYTSKEARVWLLDFMKKEGYSRDDIKIVGACDTDYIPMSLCANARLLLHNVVLPSSVVSDTHGRIRSIIQFGKKSKKEVSSGHRENSLIASLENVLDTFYNSNLKYFDPDIKELLSSAPIRNVKEAGEYYKELLEEVTEADEGYEHLSKKQLKDYRSFVEKIVSDINHSINNTKNEKAKIRKPRKKKAKTVEQIVKGIKYKEADKELNIVSIPPSSIVGASVLWLFNTKYRTLSIVYAAEGQTLSLKGTTLLNFDEKKSRSKKVRKPSDVLSKLLSSGKAVMRQTFNSLKTKDSGVTGRINKDTLLLKAFK